MPSPNSDSSLLEVCVEKATSVTMGLSLRRRQRNERWRLLLQLELERHWMMMRMTPSLQRVGLWVLERVTRTRVGSNLSPRCGSQRSNCPCLLASNLLPSPASCKELVLLQL